MGVDQRLLDFLAPYQLAPARAFAFPVTPVRKFEQAAHHLHPDGRSFRLGKIAMQGNDAHRAAQGTGGNKVVADQTEGIHLRQGVEGGSQIVGQATDIVEPDQVAPQPVAQRFHLVGHRVELHVRALHQVADNPLVAVAQQVDGIEAAAQHGNAIGHPGQQHQRADAKRQDKRDRGPDTRPSQ